MVLVEGSVCTVLTLPMVVLVRRGSSFSAALSEAHAKGITEPDPRDDLSVSGAVGVAILTMLIACASDLPLDMWMQGADVARKMVILAREMGLRVDVSSVQIERLIPEELFALSVPEFLAELPSLDAGASAHSRQSALTAVAVALLAAALADGSADVCVWFNRIVPEAFQQRWSDADSHSGARLAYLGTISAGGELRVALEEVPPTSVFAHTQSAFAC